jgi:hypothetical protein
MDQRWTETQPERSTYPLISSSGCPAIKGSRTGRKKNKRFLNLLTGSTIADLQYICIPAEEGKLFPVNEKLFTLDEVPKALQTMGRGSSAGKLVITIWRGDESESRHLSG